MMDLRKRMLTGLGALATGGGLVAFGGGVIPVSATTRVPPAVTVTTGTLSTGATVAGGANLQSGANLQQGGPDGAESTASSPAGA